MLNLGIGLDLFQNFVEHEAYYIDKTAYIAEFFDTKGKNVKLITRPRRFGKTLTLSMLDCFFSVEHKDMKSAFEKLAIGKRGNKYMDLQGQYPVIFLTLKAVASNTKEEMMIHLASHIASMYNKHYYLLKSNILSDAEKEYFQSILYENIAMEKLDMSLLRLTEFLHRYYKKKVVLLVDEYDAPLQQAWSANYYSDIISFFRNWYSMAFKTNPYLEFAVLTGITRISKESIFSGLNNLDIYTVTDDRLSGMIGFTAEEVEKLAKDAGAEDKLSEIKEWYDGYLFGKIEIYNPWSLLKYIDMGCTPNVYWANTSSNDILKNLLHKCNEEKAEEIRSLVDGKAISVYLDEGTVYADIFTSDTALYAMMLSTGYLKAQKSSNNPRKYELSIPNKEIASIYCTEIINNMGNNLDNTVDRLLESIICGDAESFQRQMQKILLQSASYHDVANEPEIFYHALMLGLTVGLQPVYSVKSNREAGYGRFDLAFFPTELAPADAMAVVMEFKKASSEGKRAMNNACKKALEQIEKNQYLAECNELSITKVLRYGIAFNGKAVQVMGG